MKKILLFLFVIITLSFANTFAQQRFTTPDPSELNRKDLLIPNAFSPNGDGNNDFFKILNFTDQTLIEFKIFNRWGSFVFDTKDPKKGWDGKYKGVDQPIGVYGYIIRIVYPEGIENTYKGTVTLIR